MVQAYAIASRKNIKKRPEIIFFSKKIKITKQKNFGRERAKVSDYNGHYLMPEPKTCVLFAKKLNN